MPKGTKMTKKNREQIKVLLEQKSQKISKKEFEPQVNFALAPQKIPCPISQTYDSQLAQKRRRQIIRALANKHCRKDFEAFLGVSIFNAVLPDFVKSLRAYPDCACITRHLISRLMRKYKSITTPSFQSLVFKAAIHAEIMRYQKQKGAKAPCSRASSKHFSGHQACDGKGYIKKTEP